MVSESDAPDPSDVMTRPSDGRGGGDIDDPTTANSSATTAEAEDKADWSRQSTNEMMMEDDEEDYYDADIDAATLRREESMEHLDVEAMVHLTTTTTTTTTRGEGGEEEGEEGEEGITMTAESDEMGEEKEGEGEEEEVEVRRYLLNTEMSVMFVARRYRIVFMLDISPSIASVVSVPHQPIVL